MSLLKVNQVTDLTGAGSTYMPGHVVQVIESIKTDTFSTTSVTLTEVTGLSVSITPKSSSSKILVSAMVPVSFLSTVDNGRRAFLTLFRGTTNLANPASPGSRTPTLTGATRLIGANGSNAGFHIINLPMTYLDSPSTTSNITYSVRAMCPDSDTLYVNRSVSDGDFSYSARGVASITVMEIAQ